MFTFDEEEYAENAEDTLRDLERVAKTPTKAPETEEVDVLADVDLRLDTADYYRAIINHDFFESDSRAAQVVLQEVRAFIKERLEILLGIRGSFEQEPLFTQEEVQALKVVASKVLGKPALVAGVSQADSPKLQVPERRKPQIRKVTVLKPETKKAAPPPPQRAVLPPQKTPSPPPATETVSVKAEPPKAKKQLKPPKDAVTQTYIDTDGNQVTLVQGSVIEENGIKFKVVMNDQGTLYRKSISHQVIPSNRTPPPSSAAELEMLSEQATAAQAREVDHLDKLTGAALMATLRR